MKIYLFCFLIGLLVGLLLSAIGCKKSVKKEAPSITITSPKTLQAEVDASEQQYAKRFDSLKAKNTRLGEQLSDSKIALAKEKEVERTLQESLFSLLDERYKQQTEGVTVKDSLCDSISALVPQLITEGAKKDSLQESVTANLQTQLLTKDSALQLKEELYSELKGTLSKSLTAQQGLDEQNALLLKEAKGARRKSKLLSAALFLLSGAAAGYLLTH